MIVIKDPAVLKEQPLVATIGFFDGVHLGHRFLVNELQEVARIRRLPSAVITFAVHPRMVLQADYQPKLLNSFEEKLQHLSKTGIDYCIVLDFTPELAAISAQAFISSVLTAQWKVKTLLIGYDHRFGHDRTDGFEQYVAYGKKVGMEVINASSYTEDQQAVSSSEIRRRLAEGEVGKAAHLLTYPYQLKGTIIAGKKIGRTLGFPTANIRVDEPFKIIPCIGIYAVWVHWEGRRYKGMLYIGDRPTIDDSGMLALEVHILDFTGDLYNKEITVSFIKYIRGDVKFDSLEALKEQLMHDREVVLALLNEPQA